MHVLPYLSYGAALVAFSFITLSLASGLLYVAELIEENSGKAKIIGMRTIYAILALHALLYFTDALPLKQTLFSMLCHVVYLQNFSATWPFISLTSPSFLGSCLLVIVDHFLWFIYFTSRVQHVRSRPYRGPAARPSANSDTPTFAQMATFFGFCVWLVPLFLFLSLSANDNALPTAGGSGSNATKAAARTETLPRRSLFGALFDSFPRAGRRRAAIPQGLIAPSASQTPRRAPSPMPYGSLNDAPLLSPSIGAPPRSPGAPPRSPSRSSFENRVDAFPSSDFRLGNPPTSRSTSMGTPSLTPSGVGLGLRPRSPGPGIGNTLGVESTKNR